MIAQQKFRLRPARRNKARIGDRNAARKIWKAIPSALANHPNVILRIRNRPASAFVRAVVAAIKLAVRSEAEPERTPQPPRKQFELRPIRVHAINSRAADALRF